jgi:hypothetical protein
MNTEVIKAINKTKKQKNKIRKWWKKNGYKVLRVIFFPYVLGQLAKERIDKYLNSRTTWNDEKAKEIFDYYIPRKAEWDDEDKYFYFFDNGRGWGHPFSRKYLKRKHRRFWDNNNGFCGGKLRTYLIEKFELEGFTKIVYDRGEYRTEIKFVLKEK